MTTTRPQIFRRTFEAAKHPLGSAERARLNQSSITSEYQPSHRYTVQQEFRMSDGSLHPQRWIRHEFRTKTEAEVFCKECAAIKQPCRASGDTKGSLL